MDKANKESTVNRTIGGPAEAQLTALSSWKGLDNPWLPEAEKDVDYLYINLLVNPERYTGYTVRAILIPLTLHTSRLWYSASRVCA